MTRRRSSPTWPRRVYLRPVRTSTALGVGEEIGDGHFAGGGDGVHDAGLEMDFDGARAFGGVAGLGADAEGFGDGVDEDFAGDAFEVFGGENVAGALEQEDARGADIGDFVDSQLANFPEHPGPGRIIRGMNRPHFYSINWHESLSAKNL